MKHKPSIKNIIKDSAFSLLVIGVAYCLNMGMDNILGTRVHTTTFFILGVFLIALKTEGYIYGILSSLLSVVAVNFAFTYPYYAFDFLSPQNLASAGVMLILSTVTSAMTTKLKEQDRIKTETELEKMRGNLLRAISHDLRTPLTSIYGSTSAIIENYDSLGREQQLKLLKEVKNDSDWLIRMVENLLSVTRIDGDVRLVKSPVVLEELVDAVVLKFQKRYTQDVIIDIPDDFISVYCDPLLIEQVLINLLENTVLHAEGMTELRLTVKLDGEKAKFSVIDNGCGINNQRPRRFASDSSEKPVDGKKHSMGIGLSVCSAIIKAHGSTLSVLNRPQGGAEVSFALETEEP